MKNIDCLLQTRGSRASSNLVALFSAVNADRYISHDFSKAIIQFDVTVNTALWKHVKLIVS